MTGPDGTAASVAVAPHALTSAANVTRYSFVPPWCAAAIAFPRWTVPPDGTAARYVWAAGPAGPCGPVGPAAPRKDARALTVRSLSETERPLIARDVTALVFSSDDPTARERIWSAPTLLRGRVAAA